MRRPGRRPGTFPVALAVVALVATGCHTPSRLGVSTTVVGVSGRCDTSSVVSVGAALPLSGAGSAVGRAELLGLELGVSAVNRGGGVLSSHRCLLLLYKDDRSNPAVDSQAMLDLVYREHVSLVVGGFPAAGSPGNPTRLGALGVTAASFSAAGETFAPNRYPDMYPMVPSVVAQAQVLATEAKRLHLLRVAVVRSSSPVAAEGSTAFVHAARAEGITVTAAPRIADSRDSAMSSLRALRATGPTGLIVFDTGPTLTPLLAARHAMGWPVPVLASTGDVPALPAALRRGTDVVVPQAMVVSRGVPSGLASFRATLVHALRHSELRVPMTPYAQAYDAIEMFAGAANGVDAYDAGSVGTYLENANFEGLLGSYNYTSSEHEGLGESQITLAPLSSLSDGLFTRAAAG